jgi:recombination protein RecR
MAAVTPEPVTRLIEAFAQLPGIGPKTASRLTFYMLRRPAEHIEGQP